MLKINSSILTDDIIDKMKEQLKRTKKDAIERGFLLTRSNNFIETGKSFTGDRHEVVMLEQAINIQKIAGIYHTHSTECARMTATDLESSCLFDISCIGGVKDNKIKCFVRKKLESRDADWKKKFECNDKAKRLRKLREAQLSKRGIDIDNEEKRLIILKEKFKFGKSKLTVSEISSHITSFNKKVLEYEKDREKFLKNVQELVNKYFNMKDIK